MADLNRRALLGSVAAIAVTAAAGMRRAPGLAYAAFDKPIPLERFGVDLASGSDSLVLSQVRWATDRLSPPRSMTLMKLWRDGKLMTRAEARALEGLPAVTGE